MKPDKDRLWLTRHEAAEICGLKPRHWSDVIRPRLDESAVRGKAMMMRFWAPAVVKAEAARQVELAKPSPVDDDPLLADGGDSPALERYRLASAKLKEKDLAERETDLVRRQAIEDAMRPATSAFRGGIERVRKTFGNEAGDMVNEMVDDYGDAVIRMITDLSKGNADGTDRRNSDGAKPDGGDESPKAQVDSRVRGTGNHRPGRPVRRAKVST